MLVFLLADLVRRGKTGKMAVVVSAMGGKPKVTDLLLKTVSLAAVGDHAGSEVRTGASMCEALLSGG